MKDAIALAEEITSWIDTAQAVIKANPQIFVGLNDLSGLKSGLLFFRYRFIPDVKTNYTLPPVVIFCGGTNTGKSTLVNSLVGKVVSPTGGGIASFTKKVIAVGPDEALEKCISSRSEWKLIPYSDCQKTDIDYYTISAIITTLPDNLPMLLDTPDVDSSDYQCRKRTMLALAFPDIIVWITTQQKYKDKSGLTFLDDAFLLLKSGYVVFNQFLLRHTDAFEDMVNFYNQRWPKISLRYLKINEIVGLKEDGLISSSDLEPLKEELIKKSACPRKLKIANIMHALNSVGSALILATERIKKRRNEFLTLRNEIISLLDETLFIPLRRLPGNNTPFELQERLVRVIGPRLENIVGYFISKINSTAKSMFIRAMSSLTWKKDTDSNVLPSPDPVSIRDREDLVSAQKIIENARFAVLEKIRKKARKKNPLFLKIHAEVKKVSWPEPQQLANELELVFHNGVREKLFPIIEKFEKDLCEFCDANQALMVTLKATIPGISALAAIAAAIFSIHTFAILPGVSEYLLGGIAFPVFTKLHQVLPEKLVEISNLLSSKPFIRKAREDFKRVRTEIFVSAAEKLFGSIMQHFVVPELPELDVKLALEQLQKAWEQSVCLSECGEINKDEC